MVWEKSTRHMTKTMVNKTNYKKVTVCRNDLQFSDRIGHIRIK